MEKIYTVTVSRFEWEDIIDQKPFSSLKKAIEYANAYGTYKTEGISRCFEDDERFDETNWQYIKNIVATHTRPDREKEYTMSIDDISLDDFNDLECS